MASRRRAFIASMKLWSFSKTGAVPSTAASERASVTSVTASKIQPMTASVEKARPQAMTHMTGTGKIMRIVMSSVCCTTLASESVRVTIEPVPIRLKSSAGNLSDAS